MGLWAWGLEFGVSGFVFRVPGLRFEGWGSRVWGSRIGVTDSGLSDYVLGVTTEGGGCAGASHALISHNGFIN